MTHQWWSEKHYSKWSATCTVKSDSLQPHEPQHARTPCPLPTPRVYPNSCPLSWWCHLTISSSVVPFSSCPRSFPPLGSFQISQLLASGGYWSFNLSISPSNEHPGLISFRIDWLDLLAVQGTLRSLLQQHSSKASILCSAFYKLPSRDGGLGFEGERARGRQRKGEERVASSPSLVFSPWAPKFPAHRGCSVKVKEC